MSEVKQVIVIRKDLGMRKGKMIAQGAHAAMAWLTNFGYNVYEDDDGWTLCTPLDEVHAKWIREAFTKVCVSVGSEDELREIVSAAEEAGILVSLIRDQGRTEFGGVPTYTCCAVGPDYADKIDAITGHLKLL